MDGQGQTDSELPEFTIGANENAGNVEPSKDIENDNEKHEIENSKDVVFHPPVYIQRYNAVREVLQKIIEDTDVKGVYVPKTIFEVGCAEFKMLVYLKNIPSIDKVIFMDIDEGLLEEKKFLLRPLPVECVLRRETPLVIDAYAGDITKVDQRILVPNMFSVIAIEVIEHLHPDVLSGFEKSVFGVIKAPVVIVTTPNADFNVLFNLAPGKFRHWDHKFEWTRAEFLEWCAKICSQYPSYSFTVEGIGEAPSHVVADVGCVSQMAIFRKQLGIEDLQITQNSLSSDIVENGAYKLLTTIEFPFYKDETPEEERILRELKYYLNCYVLNPSNLEYYRDLNQTEIHYRLDEIQNINSMPGLAQDSSILKIVLMNGGYVIEDDCDGNSAIVLQVPNDEDIDNEGSLSDDEVSRGFGDYEYESIPQGQVLSPTTGIVEGDASMYEEESWE